MPPFWTAYSLTLTETVGGTVLALPIALAGVGPIPGLILLIILGLVNNLTITGVVEAITRNGNMHYGTAYFGRLVGDYLGKPGSIILVPALILLNVTTLIAFYIGISISLADITNISPLLWSALVFLLAVYFLRRESLNATVATALVIGMINILILIVLSLLAFPQIQAANLKYVSPLFEGGQLFNPKILELIFGVVLFAYFGHTSAGNAAKVVLRRDPGGYVILAMGIGTIHMSYGLYFQVREALPLTAKKTTQFLVSMAPILLLFIVVEWMFLTGRESFSWFFGVLGVILLPLLGGIFPMLMLVASRRKGDYTPRLSFGFLGNPLILTIIYLIYLGSVFVYGFFIWGDPAERFMAIGVGFVVLIVTYLVIRQGAFTPRVVIELKVETSDTNERATLNFVDAGKPLAGTFKFIYANEEKFASGVEVEIPSYKQLRNIFIEFSPVSSKEIEIILTR
ncbi:MAG: aromatic amino acid transport family protein [Anaerolineae bacterium]